MLGLLLLLTSPIVVLDPLKKVETSLDERVDAATFICVGTVDAVVNVECPKGLPQREFVQVPGTLEIARIRIERVIKGSPSTSVVYHEGWGTWTCDMTSSRVGVRCLFFLASGTVSTMPTEQRRLVEHAVGSAHIFRNVFSGDGIVPIVDWNGESVVWCRPAPPSLFTDADPNAPCRWASTLPYVEDLARFAPESLTVRAQHSGPGARFNLRILPDGRRRLATWSRASQPEAVRLDQLDPARWKALQAKLDGILGTSNCELGGGGYGSRRSLVYRGTERWLTFSERDSHTRNEEVRQMRHEILLRTALESWAEVRGSIDCDACPDDRERDRKRIDELKRE